MSDAVYVARQNGRRMLINGVSVWVAMWTLVCLFIAWRGAFGAVPERAYLPYVLAGLLLADLVVAAYLTWLIFGSTRFELREDELRITKRLWCFASSRTLSRSSITAVLSFRDDVSDEGRDSGGERYGLVLCGLHVIKVVGNQSHEEADRLANMITRWSGAEYQELGTKKPKCQSLFHPWV